MEDIRQYLLSVVAAAVICAILNTLMEKKGTVTTVVKMLTGLFMAVTVVSPWVQIRLSDFWNFTDSLGVTAGTVVAEGEKIAQDATAAIIKKNIEAYILDKAASLELDIEVEVRLASTNPWNPEKVYLKGSVSPYAKARLCQYIAEDLGISEENQIWT